MKNYDKIKLFGIQEEFLVVCLSILCAFGIPPAAFLILLSGLFYEMNNSRIQDKELFRCRME
ncbi:CLUMA_CG004492, isoform A [Clunio marinus]|uniref:CLUMA_CG004492, isoform A n=1 Tax=Clunio marinus TaxID=568069 RepID=A0A1J1HTB2_9DIPT|nr:CLUMA_CG004492, isoform A [Clunio marinus]